jgi:hypothetical protein
MAAIESRIRRPADPLDAAIFPEFIILRIYQCFSKILHYVVYIVEQYICRTGSVLDKDSVFHQDLLLLIRNNNALLLRRLPGRIRSVERNRDVMTRMPLPDQISKFRKTFDILVIY